MTSKNNVKLFLVDDDAFFLRALELELLLHADFEIQTFATGELCILHLAQKPDVIVLDYHLDSVDKTAMNGLATLDMIKASNPDIPVIMLSSQDKIEVAVNCMRHLATDYVVKSETASLRLQKIIAAIFLYKKMEKVVNWYKDRM
jgi:two-component system OmpR family response regulator